jgi:uncharacterized protein YcnI
LLFVVPLALTLLALVPFAHGAGVVVSGSGVIAGTAGTYTLTITNTGDEPIACFAMYGPTGTVIASAQGPAGWVVGTAAGGVAFGGQNQASPIPPGQSRTFTFRTNGDYPVDPVNDRLLVSGSCAAGSDRQGTLTGPRTPVAPPPPDDGSKPCKCAKLTVKLDGTLINKAPRIAPDDHDFGVGFRWFMTCSSGKGKCKGTIFFSPPEILAGELPEPKQNLRLNLKKLAFVCQGPCTKSVTRRFEIKMLAREQLRELFGRTLAYTIKTKCGNMTKTVKVRVSINQNGKLRRLS